MNVPTETSTARLPTLKFIQTNLIVTLVLLFAAPLGIASPYIKGQPPAGDTYITIAAGINEKSNVGLMGAYGLRLEPNGFIPPINDSISIEGVAVMRNNKSGTSIFAIGGMRWDFHLSPNWSVFARPESAIKVGDDSDLIPLSASAGAFYRFSQSRYLRFEYSETVNMHHVGLVFIL